MPPSRSTNARMSYRTMATAAAPLLFPARGGVGMGGADTGSCDEARRTRFVGGCGYWPTVGGRCGVARPSLPIPLARGGGEGKAAWRLSCATSAAAHPWRSTWAAEQLWRSETRPIIRDGRGAGGEGVPAGGGFRVPAASTAMGRGD